MAYVLFLVVLALVAMAEGVKLRAGKPLFASPMPRPVTFASSPRPGLDYPTTWRNGLQLEARSRLTSLWALPPFQRRSGWRYLPLRNEPQSMSMLSLFRLGASKLQFVAVGAKSQDYQRYLPPQSNLRLAKSLLRRSLSVTSSVISTNPAMPTTAAIAVSLSPPQRLLLLFRVVLEVIAKKVRSAMGGAQILTTAPTVSRSATMEEAQAWSARKIKELELVVSAAVVTGAKDTYWPVLTVGQQLQILTVRGIDHHHL